MSLKRIGQLAHLVFFLYLGKIFVVLILELFSDVFLFLKVSRVAMWT